MYQVDTNLSESDLSLHIRVELLHCYIAYNIEWFVGCMRKLTGP